MKEITNGELQAILKQHPESYEIQLQVEHNEIYTRYETEIDKDQPVEIKNDLIVIRETEEW